MFVLYIFLGEFLVLSCIAFLQREPETINDENPYLHPEKKGILPDDMKEYIADVQKQKRKKGLYEKRVKRILDVALSFCGLVILLPLYVVLALAVVIDDPGPVFFQQKRVGKGKTFFKLHKFRSMKMSTPHDIPTHMLANPDQYITRIGKFLRKSSLDELPQIWDIFRGRMSVIGPRPALWNQADLVLERARYGANDVTPGLTGWAQINGRDELEIDVKAKLDGEYCSQISFLFDCKCFFGTIRNVVARDGVVEGGTGELHKKNFEYELSHLMDSENGLQIRDQKK